MGHRKFSTLCVRNFTKVLNSSDCWRIGTYVCNARRLATSRPFVSLGGNIAGDLSASKGGDIGATCGISREGWMYWCYISLVMKKQNPTIRTIL